MKKVRCNVCGHKNDPKYLATITADIKEGMFTTIKEKQYVEIMQCKKCGFTIEAQKFDYNPMRKEITPN